jgi:hypothetical protein
MHHTSRPVTSAEERKAPMTKELPSPEFLRKLLHYEPDTGRLFWRERARKMFSSDRAFGMWNSRYANKDAGHVDDKGYVMVKIRPFKIRAHRIAWAMYFDRWPDEEIDHINGYKQDNRIINLRDVSKSKNQRNAAKRKHNTSGHNGVGWNKGRGKWVAYIKRDGKQVHLGLFGDIGDAIAARKAAEVGHGYAERHGK